MPPMTYGKRPRKDAVFTYSNMFASSPAADLKKDEIQELVQEIGSLDISEKALKSKSRTVFVPTDTNIQQATRKTSKKVVGKDATQPRTRKAGTKPNQPSDDKPKSIRTRLPSKTKETHGGGLPSGNKAVPRSPGTTSKLSPCHSYTAPLLSLCADPAYRYVPTPFSEWSNSLESHFTIVKIAEASYGEVYRLVLKSAHPQFTSADESVLKVLALKPPPTVQAVSKKKTKAQLDREYNMSTVANVAAEVRLLQRMTTVPGFTNFRDLRVLHGRPSPAFGSAWKKFNAIQSKHEKSHFPDPAKKASYDEDQLWVVIEMQDAGTDLEHAVLSSVWCAWDVFWGVALALAKGEREARFEHRDLHMGNICVRPRKGDTTASLENVRIGNVRRKLGFSGLETTIIDYTLSRAEMLETSDSAAGDPDVAFLDLAKEQGIFEADATDEYQYEIYRYMRSAMYFSDATADYASRIDEALATGRTWAGFHPQTNLVWLHFMLHELLKGINWKTSEGRLEMKDANIVDDQGYPLEGEDLKAARNRATELGNALRQVKKLLRVDQIPREGLASVVDLIAVALERGWLGEDDVVGDYSEGVSRISNR